MYCIVLGAFWSQSVDVLYCVRRTMATISHSQWMYCFVLGALWSQSVDVLYCVRRTMATISGCLISYIRVILLLKVARCQRV